MLSRTSITAAAAVLLSCRTFNQAQSQFQSGEFITYGQDDWGGAPSPGNAAQLLLANYDFVYPANGVEVGINGPAGFSMVFTGAGPVLDYLPASGGPGSLNADLVDPSSTSSGIFGGFVLALQFDVDFTDSGVITGSAGIPFGDLVLHDLIATPLFNGFSVQQFLGWANDALGGTVPPYTFDDLAILIRDVTDAFEGGTPTQFAQDHLRIAGDFNGDGAVDAADYVVWRKNNGSVAQYNEWRANFGQPTGSGSHSATGTAVPEPATRALILLSALALACRRAGRI